MGNREDSWNTSDNLTTEEFLNMPSEPSAEEMPLDTRLAFGASEAACIHYPDDTPEHKAARAAYMRGAADAAPLIQSAERRTANRIWEEAANTLEEETGFYDMADATLKRLAAVLRSRISGANE